MKFSSTECRVMHLGIDNRNFSSKLGANQLEVMEDEKWYWLITE